MILPITSYASSEDQENPPTFSRPLPHSTYLQEALKDLPSQSNNFSSVSKTMDEKILLISQQEQKIQEYRVDIAKLGSQLTMTKRELEKKNEQALEGLKKQKDENGEILHEIARVKACLVELTEKNRALETTNTSLRAQCHKACLQKSQLERRVQYLKENRDLEDENSRIIEALQKETVAWRREQSRLQQLKGQIERKGFNLEQSIKEYQNYLSVKERCPVLKQACERCIQLEEKAREIECFKIQKVSFEQKITQLEGSVRKAQSNASAVQSRYNQQLQDRDKQYRMEFEKKASYCNKLEGKLNELVSENERISKKFNEYVQENEGYRAKMKEEAYASAKQLNEEMTRILKTISTKQSQIQILKAQFNEKQHALSQATRQNYELMAKYEQLEHRIQQERADIRLKDESVKKELQAKVEEVDRKESLIQQTNKELRAIKQVIGAYKQKIYQLNHSIDQVQVRLETEKLDRKKSEQKMEEDIKYYQAKYEEMSRQNTQMTEKICQVQKDHTEQVKKGAQLLKLNHQVEQECRIKQESWEGCEVKLQEEIVSLYEQNKKLKQSNLEEKKKKSEQIQKSIKIQLDLEEAKLHLSHSQQKIQQLSIQIQNLKVTQASKVSRKCQQLNEERDLQHQDSQARLINCYEAKIAQIQSNMKNEIEAKSIQLSQAYRRLKQYERLISEKERELVNHNQTKLEQIRKHEAAISEFQQRLAAVGSELMRKNDECRGLHEQINAHRNTVMHLESVVNSLQNKSAGQGGELYQVKEHFKRQQEGFVRQLHMKAEQLSISNAKMAKLEQKLRFHIEQSNRWKEKVESSNSQYLEMRKQWQYLSEDYLEEKAKRVREVQELRGQVDLAEEENLQMKSAMEEELRRRKEMIEDLIREKQILYDQLRNR